MTLKNSYIEGLYFDILSWGDDDLVMKSNRVAENRVELLAR